MMQSMHATIFLCLGCTRQPITISFDSVDIFKVVNISEEVPAINVALSYNTIYQLQVIPC